MLTYRYLTYICLFKALAINKPVLRRHKGSANRSSLDFFTYAPTYDPDRTIIVKVMMNLKVNRFYVCENNSHEIELSYKSIVCTHTSSF